MVIFQFYFQCAWMTMNNISTSSGLTQKLLYITLSNLVKNYITNKEIFLNLFLNLKSDWSLVAGLFCFDNFVC